LLLTGIHDWAIILAPAGLTTATASERNPATQPEAGKLGLLTAVTRRYLCTQGDDHV